MNDCAVIELKYEFSKWMDYHGSEQLPGDAVLACVYGLWVFVDTLDEEAWFRRTTDRDELWLRVEGSPNSVIHGPRAGDEATACRRLFDCLVRNRGDAEPAGFQEAGLLSREVYEAIIDKVRRGFEENRKEALARPLEIVELARRLKLDPQPECREQDIWHTRCPGTSHGLQINTACNEFFCGYCRKSGGPEELEAFVESRKKGILNAG